MHLFYSSALSGICLDMVTSLEFDSCDNDIHNYSGPGHGISRPIANSVGLVGSLQKFGKGTPSWLDATENNVPFPSQTQSSPPPPPATSRAAHPCNTEYLCALPWIHILR